MKKTLIIIFVLISITPINGNTHSELGGTLNRIFTFIPQSILLDADSKYIFKGKIKKIYNGHTELEDIYYFKGSGIKKIPNASIDNKGKIGDVWLIYIKNNGSYLNNFIPYNSSKNLYELFSEVTLNEKIQLYALSVIPSLYIQISVPLFVFIIIITSTFITYKLLKYVLIKTIFWKLKFKNKIIILTTKFSLFTISLPVGVITVFLLFEKSGYINNLPIPGEKTNNFLYVILFISVPVLGTIYIIQKLRTYFQNRQKNIKQNTDSIY